MKVRPELLASDMRHHPARLRPVASSTLQDNLFPDEHPIYEHISMAHGARQRCLGVASTYGRRFYHSSSPPVLTVSKLLDSPPSTDSVTVNGSIRSIRNQKARSFAVIGDGTSLQPIQALLTPVQAESLSTGSAVSLTGSWRVSPNATVQAHELHVEDVSVLGAADPATFPLQKKYQSAEYLRTMPHIRTRVPFNALMLRFRSQCIAQLTGFFAENEFVQTHPPIITSSDCEGAGEVFNVATESPKKKPLAPVGRHHAEAGDSAFFRSTKYLTVSSQLHLEALAQSVGKVWTLSPTFRAEKSETSRHLSEFYMLEAEVNFVDHLEGIMTLVEDMLRNLTHALHDSKVGQEIIYGRRTGESGLETQQKTLSEELERRWRGMMSGPWPRITYTDALSLLQGSNVIFEHPVSWGMGLQADHERYIAKTVGEGQPVFVTNYPQKLKPFYMLPSSSNPISGPTVDCFDLLVPQVCEISGGSLREYRLPQLLETMQSHGLVAQPPTGTLDRYPSDEDLGSLKWYVDLRRWGSVSHGGFGLGFDRLLGYLAGVENIREVVTFPRWVGRCDC